MTLDTLLSSDSVPATNKKRSVMAFKPFTKQDAGEPDADDKKAPKGKKKGAFKAAFTKKFGDKAPPNA